MLPNHDLVVRHRNNEATQDLIIPYKLVCNTTDEMLLANIRANSLTDREWLAIEPENELTAILCASGPSVKEHLDEIQQLQKDGGIVQSAKRQLREMRTVREAKRGFPERRIICKTF
jgi:hypothetical protein